MIFGSLRQTTGMSRIVILDTFPRYFIVFWRDAKGD